MSHSDCSNSSRVARARFLQSARRSREILLLWGARGSGEVFPVSCDVAERDWLILGCDVSCCRQ